VATLKLGQFGGRFSPELEFSWRAGVQLGLEAVVTFREENDEEKDAGGCGETCGRKLDRLLVVGLSWQSGSLGQEFGAVLHWRLALATGKARAWKMSCAKVGAHLQTSAVK